MLQERLKWILEITSGCCLKERCRSGGQSKKGRSGETGRHKGYIFTKYTQGLTDFCGRKVRLEKEAWRLT